MPAESKVSRLKAAALRYRTSLTLLAVVVVTLALAVFIYPDTGPTNTPQPFGLTVLTNDVPAPGHLRYSQIKLMLDKTATDEYKMTVKVTGTGDPVRVALQLSLPLGASITRCKAPICIPLRSTNNVPVLQFNCGSDPGVKPCVLQPTGPFRLTFAAQIKGVLLGWVATPLAVIGQLPSANTYLNTPSKALGPCGTSCPESLKLVVSYTVPNAPSYDWANGPPPLKPRPSHVLWVGPLAGWNSVVVTGTNNGAASSATDEQFYSAALLGIAGGSLIGSIQEFMDTEAPEGDEGDDEGPEGS